MDIISGAVELANKANEVYGDYKTGRAVRLGSYKGPDNVKKLGHYNNKTKMIGVY